MCVCARARACVFPHVLFLLQKKVTDLSEVSYSVFLQSVIRLGRSTVFKQERHKSHLVYNRVTVYNRSRKLHNTLMVIPFQNADNNAAVMKTTASCWVQLNGKGI